MLNVSKFNNALNWWGQGLGYLFPPFARRIFHLVPGLITIEFKDELILLNHFSDLSKNVIERRQFNKPDAIEREEAGNWLEERTLMNNEVVLIVTAEFFLTKKLVFPKAANSNLRQVLSFEMSRKTPFTSEQVYFDYLLEEENKPSDNIHLELFLVPRERIDVYLDMLKSWNTKLDAIRPISHVNNTHLNVIPPEEITPENITADNTIFILTTIVCLLLVAVLYAPIINQQKNLSLLGSEITKHRKVAVQLQTLQQNKKKVIEKSQFLQTKRSNEISSIVLIDAVTKIIPDDTWITNFVMREGELQLQGESSNASTLIQTLDSSEYFTNVQFRSPITQNNTNNKDRFHLSAKLSDRAYE